MEEEEEEEEEDEDEGDKGLEGEEDESSGSPIAAALVRQLLTLLFSHFSLSGTTTTRK